MAYRVELTPRAAADADQAAEYIRQFAPAAAVRWFDGLVQAIFSLEEMPRRCPLAPEAEMLGAELRQLLCGKRSGMFRIIFRIYEEEQPSPLVRVVAIRHGARDRLQAEDFTDID
jgi:plasmid stabilization system protein ParE